MEGLGAVD